MVGDTLLVGGGGDEGWFTCGGGAKCGFELGGEIQTGGGNGALWEFCGGGVGSNDGGGGG